MSRDEPSEPLGPGPVSWWRVALLAGLGGAASAAGFALPAGPAVEALHLAFLAGSGLAIGSLAMLMFGHILGEDWLDPVRAEVEAAARTVPLLALFALPLAVRLPELYPWAASPAAAGESGLMQPWPFRFRAALYLATWSALAYWVTATRDPWRASAIGIGILAFTAHLACVDWIMSREGPPGFGLLPFAYVLTQLLAALAAAILVSLVLSESPEAYRRHSLQRALVVLILLALWTWFAQFVIVWLANLPAEAAWYLRRGGAWLVLLGGAAGLLGLALVLLVPVGVGRRTTIAGAALALAAHAAHTVWLLRPVRAEASLTFWDATVPPALALLWGAWFAAAYRRRPDYGGHREGEPDGQQAGRSSAGSAL